MFDLSQLRCFVAVAEELHFGRAASRLNMTQPPLSRQIQLLEHEVTTPLFTRNNRMVRLTPAGRSLLPEARTILRIAENAALSARRISRGEAGTVSIGFTAAASYQFLPDAIIQWRNSVPDVQLRLKEMVSREQFEALDAGQLDIGFVRPPVTRQGLHSHRVAREPLVAALPADHRLASASAVQLRDFDHEPFVMYAPDEARYFYDLVARVFSRAEVSPHYGQFVSQVHSVLALVRAGLGVALVPQSAMNLNYNGLAYRDIADITPPQPAELWLVWKEGNDNPALPHLLKQIARS